LLRIIVTFAVPAEFAPWRRMRSFLRLERSEVPLYFVEYGDRAKVWVLITGVGTRHGHAKLRNMFAQPVAACLACGLAGSLKTRYRVGTVLAAKAIKRSENGTVMNCEDSLVEIAARHGATPVDFFYTSDNVVTAASEKLRLGETADAVDMESFQVMEQARQHGVPALAVRAVSDAADRDLPYDFNRAIDEDGHISRLPILSQIAAAPWRLPQMMRFGLESSKASRNLARFLDRYLNCLANDAILQAGRWRWEAR
jgi:adenosylhomocysteine nucleosidase